MKNRIRLHSILPTTIKESVSIRSPIVGDTVVMTLVVTAMRVGVDITFHTRFVRFIETYEVVKPIY